MILLFNTSIFSPLIISQKQVTKVKEKSSLLNAYNRI